MKDLKDPNIPAAMLQVIESPKVMRERFEAVIAKPDILDRILEQVANGGSLVAMARFWSISHRKLYNWIKAQPGGIAGYDDALRLRREWILESTMSSLNSDSQSTVKRLYDENGDLIPPHKLDDETAASIQSVTQKTKVGLDSTEITQEYKFVDKLKARDMILRTEGKYLDKVEHSGSVTLEDILAKSWEKKPE